MERFLGLLDLAACCNDSRESMCRTGARDRAENRTHTTCLAVGSRFWAFCNPLKSGDFKSPVGDWRADFRVHDHSIASHDHSVVFKMVSLWRMIGPLPVEYGFFYVGG
jgi:hypothetical protein